MNKSFEFFQLNGEIVINNAQIFPWLPQSKLIMMLIKKNAFYHFVIESLEFYDRSLINLQKFWAKKKRTKDWHRYKSIQTGDVEFLSITQSSRSFLFLTHIDTSGFDVYF